jgi:hypothetical protein
LVVFLFDDLGVLQLTPPVAPPQMLSLAEAEIRSDFSVVVFVSDPNFRRFDWSMLLDVR